MGLDLDFVIEKKHYQFARDYRIFSQLSSAFKNEPNQQKLFPKELPQDHPSCKMYDGYGIVSYEYWSLVRQGH